MIASIVVTIIAAGLVAAWAIIINRRATRAKAGLDEVKTYSQMVEDLREQVDRLKSDVKALQDSNERAHADNESLRRDNEGLRVDNAALRRDNAALQGKYDRVLRVLAQHDIPVPQET